MSDADEVPVHRYLVYLCDLCIGGKGGECHTPGCALWLNRAPDMALDTEWMAVRQEEVDVESLRDAAEEVVSAFDCDANPDRLLPPGAAEALDFLGEELRRGRPTIGIRGLSGIDNS